jgi:hypothetical protein
VTRADVCASDDDDAIARLQAVLAELGWGADDTGHDSPLGVGLTRFRSGGDELTVFRDAWAVDIAGPDAAVNQVLALLISDRAGQ